MMRKGLRLLLATLCMTWHDVACQLTGSISGVFSPAECDAILSFFASLEAEEDVRQNPLLPLMTTEAPFGVGRINRFDDGKRPDEIRPIHERLLTNVRAILQPGGHVPLAAMRSAEDFASIIDAPPA